MPHPIALTDHQLSLLQQAAKRLPTEKRDEFLRGVARRLGSTPSIVSLEHAISMSLANLLGPNIGAYHDNPNP
jgi:hypothetical protein